MYSIYADDTLIYDSTVEDYKIGKGIGALETNKAGSFNFSLYPEHFYYDRFIKKKTVIIVKKSDRIIFRGRVLDESVDYWNRKEIICEGELNFLLDSVIRPFNFSGTPESLFQKFITEHNAQVDEFKRFKIGQVTVLDPNDYIARSNSGYETALSNISSRLLDSLSGYIHITHGDDGTDPIPTIHYLADFTDTSSQQIEFGANLKDYVKKSFGSDIATAIIPLGAEIDDENIDTEDPRLTIASVNDGLDYVYDEAAVAACGWIYETVIWDDVTVAANLKKKALDYLESVQRETISVELTAVDLHLLDKSIESFRYNTYIRCVSTPHKFAETMLCSKQTFDLLNPQNDSVILGKTFNSLTGNIAKLSTSNSDSSTAHLNKEVASLSGKTARYEISQQQLTSLLAQSFGIFKTEEVMSDGSTVHYMHDKPTLAESTNIWKMTGDVFAVSSDGGKTWNAGMDATGNAIMNVLSVIGIDASWINADNLTAISANLGGWQVDEEKIYKEWRHPKIDTWYKICIMPPTFTSNDGGSTYELTVPFILLEEKIGSSGEYKPLYSFFAGGMEQNGPYGTSTLTDSELTIINDETSGTPGTTSIRGNGMRINDDSDKNRVDIKKGGIFVKDSAGVIRACVEYDEDYDESYVEADKMNTSDIYGTKGRFNELYANTLTLSAGNPLTELVSIYSEYGGVDMTFTNGLLTNVKYT